MTIRFNKGSYFFQELLLGWRANHLILTFVKLLRFLGSVLSYSSILLNSCLFKDILKEVYLKLRNHRNFKTSEDDKFSGLSTTQLPESLI